MTHGMVKLDISKEEYVYLLEAFKRYIPNITVWAYGSRIKGTATPQSDLDLIVFSMPEQKLQVFDLRETLQESNLSFRVDIFIWDALPQEFKKDIEETKIVLVGKDGEEIDFRQGLDGNGGRSGDGVSYGG